MNIEHKHCRRCEVKLVPHTNIPPSRYRAKGWICNTCHRQKTTDDRNKTYPCRGCKTELHYGDISTNKWNNSNYICKPCERIISTTRSQRKRQTESAGIYCWKYNDDIIYIGESQSIHTRWLEHKCKSSIVNIKCESLYNTPIKELTFEVMCEVEDKRERLIKEYELIAQHKPPLNFPYWNP